MTIHTLRPSTLGLQRRRALAGLRVLDLAGPVAWYGTRLLADLGADVIRIEPPGGDPSRRLPPFAGDEMNTSLTFQWFNAGKRSQVLDLETAAGQADFRALAAGADVVVETHPVGWLAERGLGYQQLSTENPGLVLTSVTPFGQTGPRAGWRGTDLIGLATGGLIQLSGCPGSPPTHLGGEQGYLHAGLVAAAATLVALRGRSSTGRGDHIDISFQDAIIATLENTIGIRDLFGLNRARIGARQFTGDPLFFETRDGWVTLGKVTRRWDEFIAWLDEVGIDAPEIRGSEWYDGAFADAHNRPIVDVIRDFAASSDKIPFFEAAQRHRFTSAPVATVPDLLADPQLMAREFWLEVEGPGARDRGSERGDQAPASRALATESGEHSTAIIHRSASHLPAADGPSLSTFPGAPFKMSRTPWAVRRLAPRVSENDGESWQTSNPGKDEVTSGTDAERPPDRPTLLLSSTPTPPASPLGGLRVVDLSWMIAGPGATQVLADHGADVIRVETATHPDSLRMMPIPRPPWSSGLNTSGIFSSVNSSKRSIALNLTTESGRRILRRLLRTADIVVDNYGVDPLPKWGLTPVALWGLRPDLIIARSSVMGRSGPRSQFVGIGATIAPGAGLNALSGFPDDPPVATGTSHPDYSSNPYHLLVAILAALHYREQTGEGQLIDLSQHESTAVFNGPAVLDYSLNGRIAGQSANGHPAMAPHGVYPCRGEDRWVTIACEDDADWQRLALAIGRPDLARNPQLTTSLGRRQQAALIDTAISAWTRLHDPADAMAQLQAANVPAGAVQSATDILRDPHLAARRKLVRLDHPEIGRQSLNGPSFVLTSAPVMPRRHPPLLGQDTDDVLRDLLGLDEDAIADAYVNGAID